MPDRNPRMLKKTAAAGQTISRWRVLTIAMLIVMLITAHGLILHDILSRHSHGSVVHDALSHPGSSVGVAAGVILLVIIRHLGLVRPILALFQGRKRNDERTD